jgi:hypothetical protein
MSATIARVRGVTFFLFHPTRLLMLVGGIFAGVAYVWVASVRAVPGVERRKAARREAWRNRPRRRSSTT